METGVETKLPAAVRRRVEAAKKLADAEQTPPQNDEVSAKQDAEEEPPQPVQQQQPQEKPAEDPRERDPAYWKQRFNSTMGILRKEREEHVAEIRKMAEQIAELHAELAKLREAKDDDTVELESYLTAEQIASLGEDKAGEIVGLARKVVAAEVKKLVDAQVAPVRQRQETEERVRLREKQQRMIDALTDAVPNWQEIDQDPQWLVFCGEEDESTGMTRQEIIDNAKARFDARPIIAQLRQYIAKQGFVQKPVPQQAVPQSASTGRAADTLAQEQTPVPQLSRAEIKRRYTEIAMNRRLSDEERAKRVAELDALVKRAQEAGTIT